MCVYADNKLRPILFCHNNLVCTYICEIYKENKWISRFSKTFYLLSHETFLLKTNYLEL